MLNLTDMSFDGVRIEVGMDLKNMRLHMLDLDGQKSLTNALSKRFCDTVMSRLREGMTGEEKRFDKKSVRFFCYHPDLTIFEYKPEQDCFIQQQLTSPYLEDEMKKTQFYRYGNN